MEDFQEEKSFKDKCLFFWSCWSQITFKKTCQVHLAADIALNKQNLFVPPLSKGKRQVKVKVRNVAVVEPGRAIHHTGPAGSVHPLGWECSSSQRAEKRVTGVGSDLRGDWAGALLQSRSGAEIQQAGWW